LKKCIWCRKTEGDTPFNKLAHTIPKALGGRNICVNVCDECNSYFGQPNKSLPPIETVLKETFNISRARLLASENEIGKNKALARFSSIYFNVDFKKHSFNLKTAYKLHSGFQENIGLQMKRGLYKIFLEETERQFGTGDDEKFDFIREFARYNIGNYPIFYFERLKPIIMMVSDWVKNPELLLEENLQMNYLVRHPSFSEFELLGHVIGIATSRHWSLSLDDYLRETKKAKHKFFRKIRQVRNFNDFDLTLSIMDGHHKKE